MSGGPAATRLGRLADELTVALSAWAARGEGVPRPGARQAANAAIEVIDAMMAELHAERGRLTREMRQADEATRARVDEILRRRDGEQ